MKIFADFLRKPKFFLKGIWLILKNVRNPLNVVLLYFGKHRLVKFRNGFSEVLDRYSLWTLMVFILHGWDLRKLKRGKFVALKDNISVVFRRLRGGKRLLYQLNCIDTPSNRINSAPRKIWLRGGMKLVGTLRQFHILLEDLESQYKVFDYSDKVVLDVGGFIGETAILFKFWGAKKVIIFEPNSEHCDLAKINTALNGVDAEIHCLGVSDRDGIMEVMVSQILNEVIDIAKFDCEGCEYSLLKVPCEILRKIPMYIVEYHGDGRKLAEKFKACGFKLEYLKGNYIEYGLFRAWQDD